MNKEATIQKIENIQKEMAIEKIQNKQHKEITIERKENILAEETIEAELAPIEFPETEMIDNLELEVINKLL
jgi:hypothetical protein